MFLTVYLLVVLNRFDIIQYYLIQYGSTVYKEHEGLGFLTPKYHPKTNLIFTL